MARAGIVSFSNKLPPIGSYVSGERGGTHALFDFVAELGIGFRINITDPIHTPIAVGIMRTLDCPLPPLPCVTDSRLRGYMEKEKFSSMASFNVISDNGSIDFHFDSGTGTVKVETKVTVFSVDNLSNTVTYITNYWILKL